MVQKPLYVSLCMRDEPLTLDERRELSPDVMTCINRVRDLIRKGTLLKTRKGIAKVLDSDFRFIWLQCFLFFLGMVLVYNYSGDMNIF